MVTKRKRTEERDARPPAKSSRAAGSGGTSKPARTVPAPPAKPARAGARADAGAYSRDEAAERAKSARIAQRARRRRWPRIVFAVLGCLVMLAASAFAWDRWLRYDDATELQGTWQVHGADAAVVIDASTIRLSDDVAYSYTVDAGAKTLAFSFGNMEGSGRYRFSLDRSQLVIMDGEGYSWWSTMWDDIGWMAGQAASAVQGREPEAPVAGNGVTVLDRASSGPAAASGGAGDGS